MDDALIADMGIDGVNTAEDYRKNVRMQMIRDLLMEKKKMATKYIIDQCKENWMAQAFCKQHGVEIYEAAVDEEVGRMIEMMELTGEPVSDRDEIREMMLQNEYFNGLIGHINRIIEQKAGEVCGSC